MTCCESEGAIKNNDIQVERRELTSYNCIRMYKCAQYLYTVVIEILNAVRTHSLYSHQLNFLSEVRT